MEIIYPVFGNCYTSNAAKYMPWQWERGKVNKRASTKVRKWGSWKARKWESEEV
jgi:hypothetical protein